MRQAVEDVRQTVGVLDTLTVPDEFEKFWSAEEQPAGDAAS